MAGGDWVIQYKGYKIYQGKTNGKKDWRVYDEQGQLVKKLNSQEQAIEHILNERRQTNQARD